MIRYLSFLLFILFLTYSCSSVNKHNKQMNNEISVKEMKKDIDYVHKKLNKYHPKLDLYQSKEETEYKIDSLKISIQKPLKPNEFFVKLFPLFSSLKHGHTDLYPIYRRFNKKDLKKYKNSKSAFYNYSFFYQNDSIYLIKDYAKVNPINAGSKLLYIDNVPVDEIIKKYKSSIYGDGYNKTFSDNYFNRTFLNFITLEQGLKDSVELSFLMGENIIRKKTYREFPKKKTLKVQEDSIKKLTPKSIQREIRIKQKKYGYNKLTKTYSKELSFPTNDSTIAVLKVKDFHKGKIKKLYKEVFTDIKNHHVKNLILDIRNNGGGYIKDAHYLYSYLVEDSKIFTGQKIVANKTSFGKSMYNLLPFPTYPFLWIGGGYSYLKTTKNKNNEYQLNLSFSSTKINKNLVYHGNLYVIINGGSYSASTLLAANLYAKERGYFVGEETGGDYNGTVAGLMPQFTLPNSKLTMSIGTVFIPPIEQRIEKGHGVYPNKEIKENLHTRIQHKDPELEWILKNIKTNKKRDD